MSDVDCMRWRGEIALETVGQLDAALELGLRSHLEGCADCRAEAADLKMVGDALPLGSISSLADPPNEIPSELDELVLGAMRSAAATDRQQRRYRSIVGGLVAVGVAASAVAIVLAATPPSAPGQTVALKAPPGVAATVTLSPSSTGSDVVLHESGQPIGGDYQMSMQTSSGTWWQAGSYRITGTSMTATLSCAVAPRDISRIWVRDHAGRIVMHAYVS